MGLWYQFTWGQISGESQRHGNLNCDVSLTAECSAKYYRDRSTASDIKDVRTNSTSHLDVRVQFVPRMH